MTERVLIVAAHPDDETLGCGGTIARLAQAGDLVHVLTVTDGVGARYHTEPKNLAEYQPDAFARYEQFVSAATLLGAVSYSNLAHDGSIMPDQGLDQVSLLRLTQAIETRIQLLHPDAVYTHSGVDLNADHRRVHEAVLTACRPLPDSSVRTLLGFEVPSATEWCLGDAFRPNLFSDIAATLDLKLEAMARYASEQPAYPHPRSPTAIRALAQWRGASAGLAAAEAFEVIRLIR
jgi:N-acetylglucosamine malate deacetylase 1